MTKELIEFVASIRQHQIDPEVRDQILEKIMALPRWQDQADQWLKDRAEVMTNSLHSGDSSLMIQSTHQMAVTLHQVAALIKRDQS